MSTSNLSTSKKVGIGFYGLLAGISTVVVFTAASFFLGVAASYFLRYTRWDPAGELSAWFGLAWAWYAFWPQRLQLSANAWPTTSSIANSLLA